MAFLPGLMKAAKGFRGTVVGKLADKLGGELVRTLPGGKQLQAAGRALAPIFSKPAAAAGVGAAAGIGTGLALSGGGAPGVPALPGAGAGGALTMPGMPGAGGGIVGRGGQIMPPILDATFLRPYYRAPKGYVVIRDPASGQYYAMLRAVARANKLWKASRKPPISAGDWHKYQTARAVEKRLMRIARHGLRHHRHHSAPVHHTGRKGR